MADTALDVLREKIRKRMNDVTDNLATGSCRDFAEYRFMCGHNEGLAEAERLLLDLKEQIEEN